jgi:hypothetical protein
MALAMIGRPQDFHTAVPLTKDVIDAGKVDDHHVFPRGYLRDVGRGDLVDSVLNHCLIDRSTNIRIGKRAPSDYLSEMRAELGTNLESILTGHGLPAAPNGPLFRDDFEEFLQWRLEHLAMRLAKVTATADASPVDSKTSVVAHDDC